jgi:hypothetical protein
MNVDPEPIDPNLDINLDFGPETVPVLEQGMMPNGVYQLFLQSVEPQPTKDQELMLVLWWVVEEGIFAGRKIRDTIFIPGAKRRAEKPKNYATTMGMTRNKLEAITGKEWREQGMRLNPAELSGHTVTVAVVQEAYAYTAADGTHKSGIGNVVQRYFRPGEQAVVAPVAPAMAPQTNGGVQPAQQVQEPGSFRL